MPEANENRLAIVNFYMGSALNQAKTEAAKRPIYEDVEMVRIRWAGNTKNELHAPASDRSDRPVIDQNTNTKYWPKWSEHPDFAKQYEAFKHGQEMIGNGTPLSEWGYLTNAKREELKAINIFTVDQIANLDAASMKRIGLEAGKLKEQAKLFLDRAEGASLDARHAEEKAEMQRQIDELRAMINGDAPPAKKKKAEAAPALDSPFASMDDDSIRLWCREADPHGDQPHHRLGHAGLVAFADELNARLKAANSKAA